MQGRAKAMTNIALIRDFHPRESSTSPSVAARDAEKRYSLPVREAAAPPAAQREPQNALPFLFRDTTQQLIEAWQAPVMSEEEIETWAKLYELCPKSGMSFVEYLIARGMGVLA